MADHARFSIDTGVTVYFCDPRSTPKPTSTTSPQNSTTEALDEALR
jgi:hypothetical protein